MTLNNKIRNFVWTILMLFSKKRRFQRRTWLYLDIFIAHHCNLNCKGCTSFSPLVEEHFYDYSQLEKHLNHLFAIGAGHDRLELNLLGGEPLLHPKLNEIMSMTRKIFPNAKIRLITNGILLPKLSGEFWKTCSDNSINLCLTKYPIKLDFIEIETLAKAHNVMFEYFNNARKIKTLHKHSISLRESNEKKNFETCFFANYCTTLSDGKLYPCPISANACYYKTYFKQTLPLSSENYLNLTEVKNLDTIYDFLLSSIPFCKYCPYQGRFDHIKWESSKKQLNEWNYE
jgi:MoaA/NifB/PqqE/SkfB family radical SAM enzyme